MPGTRTEPKAEKPKVYRLRLKDGVEAASFQAGHEAIELSAENPVFETTEQNVYLGARDLPFVEEAS